MSTAKTSFFAHPVPTFAIEALLAHFTEARVPGEMREVTFTPWGGAYASGSGSTFAHRDPSYLIKHTVLVGPNGAARRGLEALAWLTASWETVHAWSTGGAYPNFPDPALRDWMTAYYGPHVFRLRAVKSTYDPGNLFQFPQSIR